jgi:hypothetical protein
MTYSAMYDCLVTWVRTVKKTHRDSCSVPFGREKTENDNRVRSHVSCLVSRVLLSLPQIGFPVTQLISSFKEQERDNMKIRVKCIDPKVLEDIKDSEGKPLNAFLISRKVVHRRQKSTCSKMMVDQNSSSEATLLNLSSSNLLFSGEYFDALSSPATSPLKKKNKPLQSSKLQRTLSKFLEERQNKSNVDDKDAHSVSTAKTERSRMPSKNGSNQATTSSCQINLKKCKSSRELGATSKALSPVSPQRPKLPESIHTNTSQQIRKRSQSLGGTDFEKIFHAYDEITNSAETGW